MPIIDDPGSIMLKITLYSRKLFLMIFKGDLSEEMWIANLSPFPYGMKFNDLNQFLSRGLMDTKDVH